MLAAFGLHHASNDVLMSIVVFAIVASIITGWATDSVMGSNGFGVIGNAILSFFGAFVGIWTLGVWLQNRPMQGEVIINVILFGAGGAMTMLIALAFIRKALQRA